MPKIEKDKHLRASVLDRLFDDEPHLSADSENTRHKKLKDLRNSVRRDLENLLNTRCCVVSPPEQYEQVQDSLMNYGLQDLATVNMLDSDKKILFTNSVEKIIKQYEPRFKSVRVSHLDTGDSGDRTVRFRIDAVLYADPAPEVVVFDSILEPVLRSVTVEESNHG